MWDKSKNKFCYRLSNKRREQKATPSEISRRSCFCPSLSQINDVQESGFSEISKKERGIKVRNTFVPRSLKTNKRCE